MEDFNVVAIDPDTENCGVAIIVDNTVAIKKLPFHNIIFDLFPTLTQKKHAIIVEAAWVLKTTFSYCYYNQSQQCIAKIAKNIGANHEIGKQLIFCGKHLDLNINPVPPIKNLGGKISQQGILNILGKNHLIPLFNLTNQDQRDAINLAVNYWSNLKNT